MSTDVRLFTPGPLTTSPTVKQAMLHDLGSRDARFISVVADIRRRLLALGAVAEPDYTAVIVQGSGTFGIEAVISSITPPGGKWLVLVNGAYGRRMAQMCAVHGIDHTALTLPETAAFAPEHVAMALAADPALTHVAVVHCETTTGLLNPVAAIGRVVAQAGKVYLVDAMSSFGAIPVALADAQIDYLVSSANKCIEGVPGFSFVLAHRAALVITRGFARTLALDLYAQWAGLENNGQFRFTPPVQALLAFQQALNELDAEGGVPGRGARYADNHAALLAGMQTLGLRAYIAPALQGPIITTFLAPDDPAYEFEMFYQRLAERGLVIYPGKLTEAETFRVGNIGRLFRADIDALVAAIAEVLTEMGVALPITEAGR